MKYPRHIAIIPDGNRTRAKEQGLSSIKGHFAGHKNTENLVRYIFSETPIEVFTIRWLSSENLLGRAEMELLSLFKLFHLSKEEEQELEEQRVNITWVWSAKWLPKRLVKYFRKLEEEFFFPESNKRIVIAINYGGRGEIIQWIQDLWKHIKEQAKEIWYEKAVEEIENIDIDTFGSYLAFHGLPPVDLVMRTKANEAKRLSGFMLRWIGYAELYFTDVKFPAFDPSELEKALQRFDSIAKKRNFGK